MLMSLWNKNRLRLVTPIIEINVEIEIYMFTKTI